MFLAVRRPLASLEVVARSLRAGAMQTPPITNVHHAVLSMLPAVRPQLASREIEARLHSTFLAGASHFRDRV